MVMLMSNRLHGPLIKPGIFPVHPTTCSEEDCEKNITISIQKKTKMYILLQNTWREIRFKTAHFYVFNSMFDKIDHILLQNVNRGKFTTKERKKWNVAKIGIIRYDQKS